MITVQAYNKFVDLFKKSFTEDIISGAELARMLLTAFDVRAFKSDMLTIPTMCDVRSYI